MYKLFRNLTENEYYQLLPKYNGFVRPEWGKPFIIETNNKVIDLNSNNLLNTTYAKICDFALPESRVSDAPTYFQMLQGFLDVAREQKINIVGKDVDFFAEVWDFREFALRTQAKTMLYFKFGDAIEELNDYYEIALRLFLFYMITEKGITATGIYGVFMNTKRILKSLYRNGLNNLKFLNVFDLKRVIENGIVLYSTECKQRLSFKSFLTMYSFLIEDVYSEEIDSYLSERNSLRIKALIEENKTPLLPTDFFNKLHDVLIRNLYNDKLNVTYRMVCGLILIDMQTGLRVSELLNLEKLSLKVTEVDDKQVGVISYYSAKNHHSKEILTETVATKTAVDTFNLLISLDSKRKSKLLAFDSNGKRFRIEGFQTRLKRICMYNCIELGILNNPNSFMFAFTTSFGNAMRLFTKDMKIPSGVKLGDIISFPNMTQFRVYFASQWREEGADDREVASMLGHSSPAMMGYYVRGKSIEEVKHQINLIKEIAEGKVNLLGPKGKAFQKKMNEFILRNHFNAEENIQQIIDGLSNEFQIRVKSGGFCIQSNNGLTCQYDYNTDEYLCAYGCCPNHCHTYFSAPVTYNKFLDTIKVIEYNKTNGFLRQVEKEMKKLKAIIIQELLPELNDLKLQLLKQSITEIICRHPDTKGIIDNLESIFHEIKTWSKQIDESEQLIMEELK